MLHVNGYASYILLCIIIIYYYVYIIMAEQAMTGGDSDLDLPAELGLAQVALLPLSLSLISVPLSHILSLCVSLCLSVRSSGSH